ncbi:ATP-binding cassette domain-containing protein [Mameliella alba]|nr:ATP-binding cassette domain-containing protein [Antarctobacter heliothermus]MBY6145518.1 ATP-binding cassette domain-containing protein [Mameliella alba]MBY6160842.1 ATP-binding cassette domain-containing protein [Mameliella alba]MBY6169312.1 ATP-binding cassette domain-containing protein [Mameliella alba]MBY6174331.1 ATP-binding cassette domain-containing protein [Mameliella alba]
MREAIIHGPEALTRGAVPASNLLPLRVEGLTLDLGGRRILDGLNLTLGQTGCTVLLGPNGAGKTQLLRLLHGLLQPTSGTVDWNGTSPAQAIARQALVFQKPVLLRRSVAANVDFVLKSRRRPRARRTELLEHVGLAHKARQPARLLSGGEAQRLALARALATDPEVLFLDEPTASLDPTSVYRIEDIIRKAVQQGTRVILVTHDIGQARRLADEVVFLHGGRVAEQGPATRFFAEQRTPAARAFVSGGLVL